MTLYGYCFYNKKVGAYTAPQFEPYNKDLKVEMMKRAYLQVDDKQRAQLNESDFYYIGEFNDANGQFTLSEKAEFLMSFSGIQDGKD